MDSSVNFNPKIEFGQTYSSDNNEAKKLDDDIRIHATPIIGKSPPYNIGLCTDHATDDPEIRIADYLESRIESLLYSLPSVTTYDQFLDDVRSIGVGDHARLFLITSINKMLYEYAYKKNQYASNSELFVGAQAIIKEQIETGKASKRSITDCSGIAPFTAKFANDLGLDADVVTFHRHYATSVKTKDHGFLIIDRELFVTGTSNFDLAMTKYQAHTGELSFLARVASPSGETRGILPTTEGQLILNITGYNGPLKNVANSMKNSTLITEVKDNPTITISANASPLSIIGKVGIDGWFWNHLNLNTNLHVLDSRGDYNFGAIQKGLMRSFGTGIKFENEKQAFRLNVDYTKGHLDAYNSIYRRGSRLWTDDAKENNIDVYRLSGTYLASFPLRRLSLKAGNEFSGVVITTKVKDEELNVEGLLMTVPQMSVFLPFQKGSVYVGSAMPIEFSKEGFDDGLGISNIDSKLGAAFMAGGSLDLGPVKVGIDNMYKSDRYSNKIDTNMNLRKGSSGPGGEVFYSKQWTNLEGYVPNDTEGGVGVTIAGWGFELAAKAAYGVESWPGESRDYTSFLVTLTP
ncbi:MAG: hypothetical protein A7315_10335 [Candidatus Altiarchaeales archaeon WOR_SM1_79]|nr:MAG: hypothetical protein A7315_10335 [Candidatus Altiarchaeales archaeon WOR_SM1_79]